MNTTISKTYSEMILLDTFKDRLKYLSLNGQVFNETFGGNRYLNQMLYHLTQWKAVRNRVIVRDEGLDLGCEGYPITGRIYVHHINPITAEDILNRSPVVFDLENLVSVSFDTHNAIHYGIDIPKLKTHERRKDDTCPWKN